MVEPKAPARGAQWNLLHKEISFCTHHEYPYNKTHENFALQHWFSSHFLAFILHSDWQVMEESRTYLRQTNQLLSEEGWQETGEVT